MPTLWIVAFGKLLNGRLVGRPLVPFSPGKLHWTVISEVSTESLCVDMATGFLEIPRVFPLHSRNGSVLSFPLLSSPLLSLSLPLSLTFALVAGCVCIWILKTANEWIRSTFWSNILPSVQCIYIAKIFPVILSTMYMLLVRIFQFNGYENHYLLVFSVRSFDEVEVSMAVGWSKCVSCKQFAIDTHWVIFLHISAIIVEAQTIMR